MKKTLVILGTLIVLAVFAWQGMAASGNPDPTQPGMSAGAMILSSGVLVFREGLEAILVLAAVTAGMARTGRTDYLKAVPVGAAAAFAATIATWYLVVFLLSHIPLPELDIQAATGLLAIVVLLVVMNWFFHKMYWTGWIASHSNRRRKIMEVDCRDCAEGGGCGRGSVKTFVGLALLGFTAIYREGFEIVLFLQNLRLRAGDALVLKGATVGVTLTAIVAVLTFIAHRKLPYKRMLIGTGALLVLVLIVMVGEQAQEMQQAGWIATTPLPLSIPAWLGVWLSIFPTLQTIAAQVAAVALVLGSYAIASRLHRIRPKQSAKAARSLPVIKEPCTAGKPRSRKVAKAKVAGGNR